MRSSGYSTHFANDVYLAYAIITCCLNMCSDTAHVFIWQRTHLASDGLFFDQLINDVIDGFPVVPDVLKGHLV